MADGMRKLSGCDWVLAIAVFVTSGVAAYFGLQLAQLPMGHPAVVGLTPLCAIGAALACAYTWQFDSVRVAGLRLQAGLLGATVVIALGSAAIGIRAGHQGLFGIIAHGIPVNIHLEIVLPWVWILGVALGAIYLQLWTLVRCLMLRYVRQP